jgi:hypothetical protein
MAPHQPGNRLQRLKAVRGAGEREEGGSVLGRRGGKSGRSGFLEISSKRPSPSLLVESDAGELSGRKERPHSPRKRDIDSIEKAEKMQKAGSSPSRPHPLDGRQLGRASPSSLSVCRSSLRPAVKRVTRFLSPLTRFRLDPQPLALSSLALALAFLLTGCCTSSESRLTLRLP